MAKDRFDGAADVKALANAFHETHQDVFAVSDRESQVETVGWNATVSCRIREHDGASLAPHLSAASKAATTRRVYFKSTGFAEVPVYRFEMMKAGEPVSGPALVESAFTTVVLDPGAKATRRPSGSLSIDPGTAS